MSPVQRSMSGTALTFSLAEQLVTVRRDLAATTRRVARTLVKEGPLRLTLVGVAAGGEMRPHQSDGPIALQVLEGEIELVTDAQTWRLATGDLLVLDTGVTHSVRSTPGGFFLLTLVGRAAGPASD